MLNISLQGQPVNPRGRARLACGKSSPNGGAGLVAVQENGGSGGDIQALFDDFDISAVKEPPGRRAGALEW
ncbi:hypothetical protein GCM10023195_76410 [Actinoallomurus liliacearum]|uniref:Uncharacterized protein n=1 Tax=Actinoallomurus liliacearum TaxID=1080073 RepID=A0ABP8TV19_9ACTN